MRRHLTAATHLDRLSDHRLEAPGVSLEGEAQRGEIERHRLQAAFEHQGSRHAGIVLEMSVEEPVVRMHRGFGAQVATPPWPTRRIEFTHLVEKEHLAALDRRAFGVRATVFEAVSKALPCPAFGKRPKLSAIKTRLRTRNRGWVEPGILRRLGLFGRPQDSLGVGEFFIAEETRLPTLDADPRHPIDQALVVKEEQPNVVLPRVTINVDLIAEGVTRLRKITFVGEFTTEQPIHPLPLIEEVGTHVRDQHQVRLPGLDHDAGGHASSIEIPGIVEHVGLGPHDPGTVLTRLGVDSRNTICQQKRRLGHSYLAREAVLLFEHRTVNLGDATRCVNLDLSTIEGGANRMLDNLVRHWVGLI